jgi:CSLREA domain-containing protein
MWWRRLLLVVITALAAAPAAHGAAIPVTTTTDVIAADGLCSLREAVVAARDNAPYQGCPAGDADAAGPDSIQLDAQPYVLSLAGAGEASGLTGDLDTGVQSLRVVGRGAAVTAIDANRIDRAFDVPAGASLALEDLTVRNGLTPTGDPGEEGGGVLSQGALSVLRVTFVANVAGDGSSGAVFVGGGGSGGAISSRPGNSGAPSLTVSDSSFIGNRAGNGGNYTGAGSSNGGVGGRGGALEVQGGLASISGSTFDGNLAGEGGDGAGMAPLNSGGQGGDGGAIYVAYTEMTVTTSTFASNRAGAGGLTGGDPAAPARGGIGGAWFADSSSTTSAAWSTFAGNLRGPNTIASAANGVFGGRVEASILADAAPACLNVTAGPLRNVALPGDPSCPGPRLDGDPALGPLAANGGPTQTLLPGPASAAIDALAGAACPATDQRGLPRPARGGCDAGAVEVQPPPATAAGTPRTAAAAARRVFGLRLRPAAFRAAGSGGSIRPRTKALLQRRPVGTTVSYRLDGAARVTFTIAKKAPGRRVGRRCVRPAAAPAGARRCVRAQRLKGSFVHQGVAGLNSFRFTGRLRRRALALGPYTLVAKLPRPATGRGALASRGFRIVP